MGEALHVNSFVASTWVNSYCLWIQTNMVLLEKVIARKIIGPVTEKGRVSCSVISVNNEENELLLF